MTAWRSALAVGRSKFEVSPVHRPSCLLELAEAAVRVGDGGGAIGEAEDDERAVVTEQGEIPVATVLRQQRVEVIVPPAGTPETTLEDRHDRSA